MFSIRTLKPFGKILFVAFSIKKLFSEIDLPSTKLHDMLSNGKNVEMKISLDMFPVKITALLSLLLVVELLLLRLHLLHCLQLLYRHNFLE